MSNRKLSEKSKGLLEVLSSHYVVLAITMLISFILPLRISVAQYGRWQLFSLIISYAGFFALGFNDGIHINYSGQEYNNKYHKVFRFFRLFIELMALFGTIASLLIITLFRDCLQDRYILFVIASFNIIPVLINGFFAYVNQGTMRFSIFAKANVLEKLLYVVMMAVLLIVGVKNAIYYCIAYTVARYFVIIYNYLKSKELLGKAPYGFNEMKPYVLNNFIVGFSLMLATICNQSIIVPGRLLVENRYGIEAFSCYSFAINTMVIANQVTTALSQVFFPSMKKAKAESFINLFIVLDKTISLLAIALLFTYYPVYLLIRFIYPEYSTVLDYLYCIYPLFVYSSKSAILVINTYKKNAERKKLLFNNLLGVVINLVFVLFAHLCFGSVFSIAIFSLIGYMLWYYLCYFNILRNMNVGYSSSQIVDVIVVAIFIVINALSIIKFENNSLLVSAICFMIVTVFGYFLFNNYCKTTIKGFLNFMNN